MGTDSIGSEGSINPGPPHLLSMFGSGGDICQGRSGREIDGWHIVSILLCLLRSSLLSDEWGIENREAEFDRRDACRSDRSNG